MFVDTVVRRKANFLGDARAGVIVVADLLDSVL